MKRKQRALFVMAFLFALMLAFSSVAAANSAIPIMIDVKPGSCPNAFNPESGGVLPVAILTTDDFDASTVDPATVLLAGVAPLRWAIEDVDFDGDLDMIFHFKTQEVVPAIAPVYPGDLVDVYLTGLTYPEYGGVPFTGMDTLLIVK